MKKIQVILILSGLILSNCTVPENHEAKQGRDYPISPVAFTQVKVTDHFWGPKIETNREMTIPLAFRKSEETGRIENFKIAGKIDTGSFCSLYPFDDSDVFKNIEAASYSLQNHPDPELEHYLDTLISFIAAAQEPDGYLYTNRTIDPRHTHAMAGKDRWVNVEESSHELYNMGHLYEAAVAHYLATGKRSLLDVAIKNANLINSVFGPGKLEMSPGHQEIELGLVKLYRLTGEKKYLDLAKFFLDNRGPGGDSYNQMHEKVTRQWEAVGHAVRAQYMYAAMADIAALTGDTSYLNSIDRLWDDVTTGKTYLTGGIGAVGDIEGFGPAYFLPNAEAYCETCASIANALWNYRMFLLHGESKYFDVLEKVLYNGLISGVSLEGDSFFYPNPLASNGNYARKAWFGCACCPVNITRFLPSVPGYVYAVWGDSVYVNLYLSNVAEIKMGDNRNIRIEQETGYPWDGKISLRVYPGTNTEFTLMLRVPGWALGEAFPTDLYRFEAPPADIPQLTFNGKNVPLYMTNGYAVLKRAWKDGDEVVVNFPMEILKVRANPKVRADSGLVAIQHGPLIYCVEQVDEGLPGIENIFLPEGSILSYPGIASGPGGIREMRGNAEATWLKQNGETATTTWPIRAIPYYAWANRGKGQMRVWLPESPGLTVPLDISYFKPEGN